MTEHEIDAYPFLIRPLSEEDGGGYLIEYPDLPGCVSDGETPEEAIRQGREALRAYVISCQKHSDPVPAPGSGAAVRIPASVDVKRVRIRCGLSQADFARRFGFNLRTLQDWERGHANPGAAVRAYLTVISRDPDAVESALS